MGFGGSLMLDYEHYRRDYDIDVELRNHLFSLGGGLELDTSAHSILWISRARLIFRYRFGENVSGYTISLEISF